MSKLFVVYYKETLCTMKFYKGAGWAKREAERMNAKEKRDAFGWASFEDFEKMESEMIKVKSLMTGEEVEIPANTPWHCRPDSESFWCN